MIRVLFLTHRLPYAPNRGDWIRAYHILNALRGRARVDLVSLVHDADEASQVDSLRELTDHVDIAPVGRLRGYLRGAAGLTTSTPLTHSLLDSASIRHILSGIVADRRPDVVLAYCSGMARFALEAPLAGLPLVIDFVDVDSQKWAALAADGRAPMRWIYAREAKWLAAFEARAARAAYATTVVNERERAALVALAPDARVNVVPSGVDWDYWRPPEEATASRDVVFCGVMNYPPNEAGAVWLAREVWPLVRRAQPDARLRLVGAAPTPLVQGLSAADSSIEVTGAVPDVRPYLWGAAVGTAPLQQARGIQNKVLEAVAAGLPTVVTPVVAEGLPARVLPACTTADGAPRFADAIVAYLQLSPGARRRLAETADLAPLAWNARLAPLVELLHTARVAGPSSSRKTEG